MSSFFNKSHQHIDSIRINEIIGVVYKLIFGGTCIKRLLFAGVGLLRLFVSTIAATTMAEGSRTVQQEKIFDVLVDRYSNGDTSIDNVTDVDDPYTFQGGDLKGITDKLDDIEEVGFRAISL